MRPPPLGGRGGRRRGMLEPESPEKLDSVSEFLYWELPVWVGEAPSATS